MPRRKRSEISDELKAALKAADTTRLEAKPTINDIARIAKVSKRTVSRVLNQDPRVDSETKEVVSVIIQRFNFTPNPQARGLALRRSNLVCLIYDDQNPQNVIELQSGILDGLAGTDFRLIAHPVHLSSDRDLIKLKRFLQDQDLSKVIAAPPLSEVQTCKAMLSASTLAYVVISSDAREKSGGTVLLDDFAGGEQAGRHLASLGHKDIGLVQGPSHYHSSGQRRNGFESALNEFSLFLLPELTATADHTFDSGIVAMEKLLYRARKPTAVFAANDEVAAGAYIAVRKAGLRIPEDMSIVGFEGSPIARRIWPALTTVRHRHEDIGRAAAKLLLSNRPPTDAKAQIDFIPEVIVRGSTAAPPVQ